MNQIVGLRIGGTNMQLAIIERNCDLSFVSNEIRFREICNNLIGESYNRQNIYSLIFELLCNAITSLGVSIHQFIQANRGLKILISFAGPISYDGRLVFRPKSIPCMREWFPLSEELSIFLSNSLNCDTGEIIVNTWMDGTSSVFAETGTMGSCPGERDAMVLISGTGVGAGFLRNGEAYFGDGINGLLGEIGYFLVRKGNNKYRYMAYETNGDISRFITSNPDNIFRHRFSVEGILSRYSTRIKSAKKSQASLNAVTFCSAREPISHSLLLTMSQDLQFRVSANENDALEFLDEIAGEFCCGLTAFITHYRHIEERFTRNIVLVGSLSSFLGVFSRSFEVRIKEALFRELCNASISKRVALEISEGFQFSKMRTDTREFIGLTRLGKVGQLNPL